MDKSIKRIFAYLIDFFLISFIASVLISLVNYNNPIENVDYEEYSQLVKDYSENKISDEDYEKAVVEFNYKFGKANAVLNIATTVLIIGYFGIYQVMANGQTLGKRLLKLKVIGHNNTKFTYGKALLRTIILNNIIFRIIVIIGIYFMNASQYNTFSYVISICESIIEVAIFIMILLRQDGRGLHDMLAQTEVIDLKVKEEIKDTVNEKNPKEIIEVEEKTAKSKTIKNKTEKNKKTKNTKK